MVLGARRGPIERVLCGMLSHILVSSGQRPKGGPMPAKTKQQPDDLSNPYGYSEMDWAAPPHRPVRLHLHRADGAKRPHGEEAAHPRVSVGGGMGNPGAASCTARHIHGRRPHGWVVSRWPATYAMVLQPGGTTRLVRDG